MTTGSFSLRSTPSSGVAVIVIVAAAIVIITSGIVVVVVILVFRLLGNVVEIRCASGFGTCLGIR